MSGKALVLSARCPDGYHAKNLRDALEKVIAPQIRVHGSLSGKKIMLKPNLLAWRKPDDPACVHPAFLLECAKIFLDAGAKVSILENPAVQTAPAVIRAMGLEDDLAGLGVQVRSFADFVPVRNAPGMRFHNFELAREYLDFDAVADLAKAKTHGMMTLTLCVKNLFGLVRGSERMAWHLNVGRDFSCFADMLLDIYLAVRPQFNLVDALVCMEGDGPGSGTDSLALDSFLAPILIGRSGDELLLIRQARERGLLPEFEQVGGLPDFSPLKLPPPPGLLCEWGVMLPPGLKKQLREWLVARPVLRKEKCVGCGLCARKCPPQTLKIVNGKARFDYPTCIRCFCCHEYCPKGAITIRKGALMGVMETMERAVRKFFSR